MRIEECQIRGFVPSRQVLCFQYMRRTTATNSVSNIWEGPQLLMYNARQTRATAGQRKRHRLPDSSPPWLGYLRGSEVTFQISSHKHDDVIAQGLRTVPCFNLKDPPACGVHRVIIKAIGIPILVQYIFDIYCLFSRHPVRSCIEDFWRKKGKRKQNNDKMSFNWCADSFFPPV